MNKYIEFFEPNSFEKMNKWVRENEDKFDMYQVFINNGFGLEYRPKTLGFVKVIKVNDKLKAKGIEKGDELRFIKINENRFNKDISVVVDYGGDTFTLPLDTVVEYTGVYFGNNPKKEKKKDLRSVKTLQSIIDEVEKKGKRPSTAYYSAKAELEGYNR